MEQTTDNLSYPPIAAVPYEAPLSVKKRYELLNNVTFWEANDKKIAKAQALIFIQLLTVQFELTEEDLTIWE